MEGIPASRCGTGDAFTDARATIAAAVSAACGLVAASAAAMLVERRLAGALGPTGMPAVVCTAAVGLLIMVLGDLATRGLAVPVGPSATAPIRWTLVATRVALVVAVAAVAVPARDGSAIGAAARILVVAGVLAAAGPGMMSERWLRSIRPWITASPTGMAGVETAPAAGSAPDAREDRDLPPAPTLAASMAASGAAVLQRLERLALPDGTECVRGSVAVLIPRGARSGTGHLGFCPPFAGQPTVEVGSDYDSVEAVITAAEVVPWGVRVECRLDEPAEETLEIPVAVVARSPA